METFLNAQQGLRAAAGFVALRLAFETGCVAAKISSIAVYSFLEHKDINLVMRHTRPALFADRCLMAVYGAASGVAESIKAREVTHPDREIHVLAFMPQFEPGLTQPGSPSQTPTPRRWKNQGSQRQSRVSFS